jgi:hypothetical protein
LGKCSLDKKNNDHQQFHLRLRDTPASLSLSSGGLLTIRGYIVDISWDGHNWFEILSASGLATRD